MLNNFNINIPKQRKMSDLIIDNHLCASYDKSLKDNHLNVANSQKITVPIKQYSNKFLLLHQKQEEQKHVQRNIKKCLLENKRKPFRKYRKFNKQNGLSKVCKTQPNCQDCIEEHQNIQSQNYQLIQEKSPKAAYSRRQQNNFFNVNASVFSHLSSLSKKQLQMYEKLYERQKSNQTPTINKYKKITQIIQQSHKDQYDFGPSLKKSQKISTSRALQKYSKIIKKEINCQDANSVLSKMKIKKQFAHLNSRNKEKSDIYTKKIVLQKKEQPHPIYKINSMKQTNVESTLYRIVHNKKINQTTCSFIQRKKDNRKRLKTEFQLEDYKQNMKNNLKKYLEAEYNDNFQINGWDINI